jgi:serine/threonine kinase 32
MGQNNPKPIKEAIIKKDPYIPKEEKLSKSSFKFLNIIGRGGFGKVWKVYSKKYGGFYAMKKCPKPKLSIKEVKKV